MTQKNESGDVVKVSFKLSFATMFGVHIAILGSHPALGGWDYRKALRMKHLKVYDWEVWVNLPLERLEYKYLLVDRLGRPFRWEEGPNKVLNLELMPKNATLEKRDLWQANLPGVSRIFQTAVFTDVIYHRDKPDKELPRWELPSNDEVVVRFQLEQVCVSAAHDTYVCGNCEALGNWDPTKAVRMSDKDFPFWQAVVKLRRQDLPISYKYIVKHKNNPGNVIWEFGTNRTFETDPRSTHSMIQVEDGGRLFYRQHEWKAAGVIVPVFSLRTEKSLGVGEFLDLKLMVDWAVEAGLHLIQLLPINDTRVTGTWWDSYPYSSLSVFALHPLYINIDALEPSKEVMEEVERYKPILNPGFLKYEETLNVKMKLTRQIYLDKKSEFLKSSEFAQFFAENQTWLAPYALFCSLRDRFGTPRFQEWSEYSTITTDQINKLTSPDAANYDEIAYYYYLQFHLSKQLIEASKYAKLHRVALKGDLPIGVDALSVDVWATPHLFRTHVQVGAPPDAFSEDGQNWGFPAYDWDAMAQTGYAWWKLRLRVLSKYFHAYRIDHILGFFRIWEIPKSCVGGLIGWFKASIPIWDWELRDQGVWDFDRLAKPYIRTYHLQSAFGYRMGEIKDKYFDEHSPGSFEFKPEYATEVQIEEALAPLEDEPQSEKDRKEYEKQALFGLMRNVVLIQDLEDPYRFYPRINMIKCDSFQALPDLDREKLYDLYISYYFKRQDDFWRAAAMEKLPMLQGASKMMVCGEDLGMIPACVQGVLDELSLLGLRVQRMPKDETEKFDWISTYPYMTVCTPSVHDTSTLRGWWEEESKQVIQRFYNEHLNLPGTAPYFCEPQVVNVIIWQHLWGPSMWSIFLIQDLFALTNTLRHHLPQEERINVPSVRHHYWRYRIGLTLEDLVANHKYLASDIRNMLQVTGRYHY